MSINVPNLLAFILANVDGPMKLHVMYSICMHTQVREQIIRCWKNQINVGAMPKISMGIIQKFYFIFWFLGNLQDTDFDNGWKYFLS